MMSSLLQNLVCPAHRMPNCSEQHMKSRIFVTRDRDFGALVFIRDLGVGVVYLRMVPSTIDAVHQELEKLLTLHSEDELRQAFVVVEAGRHRFRKLS